MSKGCKIVIGVFMAIYAIALALLAIGTWGPNPDPLSGVFLLPLGLPWNFVGASALWAILSPALNLALLVLACRWVSRR